MVAGGAGGWGAEVDYSGGKGQRGSSSLNLSRACGSVEPLVLGWGALREKACSPTTWQPSPAACRRCRRHPCSPYTPLTPGPASLPPLPPSRPRPLPAQIDPWLDYQFPTKVRAQLSGQWLRYRGQTQKWFLLEFTGRDGEVDLSGLGGEPPEFSEWRWMALDALPLRVVDFKRAVYGHVARHFGGHVERLRRGGGDAEA